MRRLTPTQIREEISRALSLEFGDVDLAIGWCCRLPHTEFAKFRKTTQRYINAQATRIKGRLKSQTPEEYFEAARFRLSADERPPAPSIRGAKASHREIVAHLLRAPGIIPTSYEITEKFGMSQQAAIDLRASLLLSLKVLRELNLYTHPTLAASEKYSHLHRRPRRKKSA